MTVPRSTHGAPNLAAASMCASTNHAPRRAEGEGTPERVPRDSLHSRFRRFVRSSRAGVTFSMQKLQVTATIDGPPRCVWLPIGRSSIEKHILHGDGTVPLPLPLLKQWRFSGWATAKGTPLHHQHAHLQTRPAVAATEAQSARTGTWQTQTWQGQAMQVQRRLIETSSQRRGPCEAALRQCCWRDLQRVAHL